MENPSNNPETLEQVRAKLKVIFDKQREIAKAKGYEARFERGIGIARQTAEFMLKIGELGDSMGIDPYQFQDAVTLLVAICGPARDVLMPGVLDVYMLLLEEKFLENPKPERKVSGFMQSRANA